MNEALFVHKHKPFEYLMSEFDHCLKWHLFFISSLKRMKVALITVFEDKNYIFLAFVVLDVGI